MIQQPPQERKLFFPASAPRYLLMHENESILSPQTGRYIDCGKVSISEIMAAPAPHIPSAYVPVALQASEKFPK
ncbi:MAG: hypothetical protein IJA63_10515 [Akkermansia sp.]|nr:hypothetical protein [Akkermansia sp.]